MRNYVPLLAVLFAYVGMTDATHAADVQASLSARETYVGNPIVVRVTVTNAARHDAPEILAMDGVDVQPQGTPSRNTHVTIVNGRRSERSSVTYAWQIVPRREGTFTIPPISVSVDGQQQVTRALRFSATKSETGSLLFTEIVGSEEQIFVGQPMELTLRIWVRPYSDSRQNLSLSEADMWQTISLHKSKWGMFADRIQEMAAHNQRPSGQEVLRADSEGIERRYYLYEIDATVYPKRPGQIDGDEVQVVIDYPIRLGKGRDPFDSFFGHSTISRMFGDGLPSIFRSRLTVTETRPIVASTDVRATHVMAIPSEGRPDDYQGAVGHYQIVAKAASTHVKAGDPITLHLGIQGDGPMELVQAPPLSRISDLVDDFRVDDEALAGLVQDDVKLFTASIRPRREGITRIPPIPFSYFDPEAQQFVTVESEPIPVTVDKADQLALDAIVGRSSVDATPNGATGSGSEAADPAIQLDNYVEVDALASSAARPSWPYGLLLALPPLGFLATFFVRHLDWQNRWTRRDSISELLNKIQTSQNASEIASLLKGYVASHSDNVSSAGTRSSQALRDESDSVLSLLSADTAQCYRDVVALCERVSFAGTKDVRLDQLTDKASNCLVALSKEIGRVQSKKRIGSRNMECRTWRDVSRSASRIGALLLLAFLVGLGFNDRCRAAELSVTQQRQIFAEANDAYARGQAAAEADSAESKQAFALAAQKYQTLADSGIENDKLYFNAGNAYLQLGAIGRAIGSYERALSMNPDSDAKANLRHVRSLLVPVDRSANVQESSFWESLRNWNGALSRSWKLTLGGVSWLLAWTLTTLAFVTRMRFGWTAVVSSFVVAMLCGASLGVDYWERPVDRAVTIAPATPLRSGNGHGFEPLGIELPEGTTCDLLEKRGEWLKVAAPGETGWLDANQAMIISARP